MAEIENAALLSAMDRDALTNDWPSRQAVYRALLDATFTLHIADTQTPSQGSALGFDPKRPPLIVNREPDGNRWMAAFTDLEVAKSWRKSRYVARYKGRNLFKLALDSGVDKLIINPFREKPIRSGGYVTRQELEILASGLEPVQREPRRMELRVSPDSIVTIEPPAQQLPEAIRNALAAAAEPLRGLTKITHFRIVYQGAPPHDAVALRCGVGLFPMSTTKLTKVLMDRIQPLMGEGDTLDVLPIGRDDHEALQKGAIIWERR